MLRDFCHVIWASRTEKICVLADLLCSTKDLYFSAKVIISFFSILCGKLFVSYSLAETENCESLCCAWAAWAAWDPDVLRTILVYVMIYLLMLYHESISCTTVGNS